MALNQTNFPYADFAENIGVNWADVESQTGDIAESQKRLYKTAVEEMVKEQRSKFGQGKENADKAFRFVESHLTDARSVLGIEAERTKKEQYAQLDARAYQKWMIDRPVEFGSLGEEDSKVGVDDYISSLKNDTLVNPDFTQKKSAFLKNVLERNIDKASEDSSAYTVDDFRKLSFGDNQQSTPLQDAEDVNEGIEAGFGTSLRRSWQSAEVGNSLNDLLNPELPGQSRNRTDFGRTPAQQEAITSGSALAELKDEAAEDASEAMVLLNELPMTDNLKELMNAEDFTTAFKSALTTGSFFELMAEGGADMAEELFAQTGTTIAATMASGPVAGIAAGSLAGGAVVQQNVYKQFLLQETTEWLHKKGLEPTKENILAFSNDEEAVKAAKSKATISANILGGTAFAASVVGGGLALSAAAKIAVRAGYRPILEGGDVVFQQTSRGALVKTALGATGASTAISVGGDYASKAAVGDPFRPADLVGAVGGAVVGAAADVGPVLFQAKTGDKNVKVGDVINVNGENVKVMGRDGESIFGSTENADVIRLTDDEVGESTGYVKPEPVMTEEVQEFRARETDTENGGDVILEEAVNALLSSEGKSLKLPSDLQGDLGKELELATGIEGYLDGSVAKVGERIGIREGINPLTGKKEELVITTGRAYKHLAKALMPLLVRDANGYSPIIPRNVTEEGKQVRIWAAAIANYAETQVAKSPDAGAVESAGLYRQEIEKMYRQESELTSRIQNSDDPAEISSMEKQVASLQNARAVMTDRFSGLAGNPIRLDQLPDDTPVKPYEPTPEDRAAATSVFQQKIDRLKASEAELQATIDESSLTSELKKQLDAAAKERFGLEAVLNQMNATVDADGNVRTPVVNIGDDRVEPSTTRENLPDIPQEERNRLIEASRANIANLEKKIADTGNSDAKDKKAAISNLKKDLATAKKVYDGLLINEAGAVRDETGVIRLKGDAPTATPKPVSEPQPESGSFTPEVQPELSPEERKALIVSQDANIAALEAKKADAETRLSTEKNKAKIRAEITGIDKMIAGAKITRADLIRQDTGVIILEGDAPPPKKTEPVEPTETKPELSPEERKALIANFESQDGKLKSNKAALEEKLSGATAKEKASIRKDVAKIDEAIATNQRLIADLIREDTGVIILGGDAPTPKPAPEKAPDPAPEIPQEISSKEKQDLISLYLKRIETLEKERVAVNAKFPDADDKGKKALRAEIDRINSEIEQNEIVYYNLVREETGVITLRQQQSEPKKLSDARLSVEKKLRGARNDYSNALKDGNEDNQQIQRQRIDELTAELESIDNAKGIIDRNADLRKIHVMELSTDDDGSLKAALLQPGQIESLVQMSSEIGDKPSKSPVENSGFASPEGVSGTAFRNNPSANAEWFKVTEDANGKKTSTFKSMDKDGDYSSDNTFYSADDIQGAIGRLAKRNKKLSKKDQNIIRGLIDIQKSQKEDADAAQAANGYLEDDPFAGTPDSFGDDDPFRLDSDDLVDVAKNNLIQAIGQDEFNKFEAGYLVGLKPSEAIFAIQNELDLISLKGRRFKGDDAPQEGIQKHQVYQDQNGNVRTVASVNGDNVNLISEDGTSSVTVSSGTVGATHTLLHDVAEVTGPTRASRIRQRIRRNTASMFAERDLATPPREQPDITAVGNAVIADMQDSIQPSPYVTVRGEPEILLDTIVNNGNNAGRTDFDMSEIDDLVNSFPPQIADMIEVHTDPNNPAAQKNAYGFFSFNHEGKGPKIIIDASEGRSFEGIMSTIAEEVAHFSFHNWTSGKSLEKMQSFYDKAFKMYRSEIETSLGAYINNPNNPIDINNTTGVDRWLLVNELFSKQGVSFDNFIDRKAARPAGLTDAQIVELGRLGREAEEAITLDLTKGATDKDAAENFARQVLKAQAAGVSGKRAMIQFDRDGDTLTVVPTVAGQARSVDAKNQKAKNIQTRLNRINENREINLFGEGHSNLNKKAAVALSRLWRVIYGLSPTGNMFLSTQIERALTNSAGMDSVKARDAVKAHHRLSRRMDAIARKAGVSRIDEKTFAEGYEATFARLGVTNKSDMQLAREADAFVLEGRKVVVENAARIRRDHAEDITLLERWGAGKISAEVMAKWKKYIIAQSVKFQSDYTHRRYYAHIDPDERFAIQAMLDDIAPFVQDGKFKNGTGSLYEAKLKAERDIAEIKASNKRSETKRSEIAEQEKVSARYDRLLHLIKAINIQKGGTADNRQHITDVQQYLTDVLAKNTAEEKGGTTTLDKTSGGMTRELDHTADEGTYDYHMIKFLDPVTSPVETLVHSINQQEELLRKRKSSRELAIELIDGLGGSIAWLKGDEDITSVADTSLSFGQQSSIMRFIETDPNIAQEMKRTLAIQENVVSSTGMKIVESFIGTIKYGATVLNPASWSINTIGALWSMGVNGHLFYLLDNNNISSFFRVSANKKSASSKSERINAIVKEMQDNKIVGAGFLAGSLEVSKRGTVYEKSINKMIDLLASESGAITGKEWNDRIFRGFEDIYLYSDEAPKIMAYLVERDLMDTKWRTKLKRSAYKSDSDYETAVADGAAREAADRTLRQTTDWGRMASFTRPLTRTNTRFVAGDFISHPLQIAKIIAENILLMKEDSIEVAREGNTAYGRKLARSVASRAIGNAGLYTGLGMAATSGVTLTGQAISKAISSFSDESENIVNEEERQGLNKVLASLAYGGMRYDALPMMDNGKFYAANTMRISPFSSFNVLPSAQQEQDYANNMKDWFVNNFLGGGETILSKTYNACIAEKDRFGNDLPENNLAGNCFGGVAKQLIPAGFKNAGQFITATDSMGRDLSRGIQGVKFAGLPVKEFHANDMASMLGYELGRDLKKVDARKVLVNDLARGSRLTTTKDIANMINKDIQRNNRMMSKYAFFFEGWEQANLRKSTAIKYMREDFSKNKKISNSKENVHGLVRGVNIFNKQTLRSLENKLKEVRGYRTGSQITKENKEKAIKDLGSAIKEYRKALKKPRE